MFICQAIRNSILLIVDQGADFPCKFSELVIGMTRNTADIGCKIQKRIFKFKIITVGLFFY